MKSFYYCISLAMSILLFSPGYSQNTSSILNQELIKKQNQRPSLPPSVSESWYDAAVKNINLREYQFKQLEGADLFGVFNRKQSLGFQFTAGGYVIKAVDIPDNMNVQWEASFALQGVGRDKHLYFPATKATSFINDEALHYRYKGFDVEYLNSDKGMRQNFIIKEKPAGKGQLKVWSDINTSLKASIEKGKGLVLRSKETLKTIKLYYNQLKVWDATGKFLPAHMELTGGNQLALVVDDSKAIYPITIDPLNHVPDWTDSGDGIIFPLLDGLSTHVLYGFTVSGAGDVNNDNIDDVIVGAPAYVDIISVSGGTFNLVSVGAAFIYYGSSGGPSATPSEALQPTALAGALFGFSVSKAGDINGDGLDDVVIGAPADRITLNVGLGTASVQVGKVYVYYGSTFDGNANTEPVVSLDVTLAQSDFGIIGSIPANPLYGFSVSNAGDVNNDGFADIVVGSPAYITLLPLPVTLGGRADVYLGSIAGLNTTPHRIRGPLLPALFGFSVSAAGKVNNDSFDDIIVGAPSSLTLLSVGAAYIFHGSASGITATSYSAASTTLQAAGLLSSTLFGYSVSNAGDVNGDGRDDVIVGEPLSLESLVALQLVAVGRAYIYYGSNTGIVTAGATTLTSPRRPTVLGLVQGNLLYGFSVSGAGDLNCDGFADVIVGEPGGTGLSLGTGGLLNIVSANVISGKAYVYYGRAGKPFNSPSYRVQETDALSVANLLGLSVSDAGDVNGDGNADFLVGAPNGTLNLGSSITGLINTALGVITQNSVGSAYGFFGCLTLTDLDFDNDGVPDAIDLDDDNDGTPDLSEYPGVALTQDPAADADGDGVPNYADADFSGCGGLNGANICTAFDKDGDGVPNSFDLDSDNDGIPDVIEAGGVDTDGDGVLDNFTDTDSDGLSQSIDLNNTGAAGSGTGLGAPDFDGDAIPNSYDLDSDADGISDLREAGLPDADNNALVDAFADTDGDGYANTLDPNEGHSGPSDPAGVGVPALTTPADSDNNGLYNGNPTTGNPDADARFNFIDLDADNDGITDNVEGQSTAGYILPGTADTDGDGLADSYDSQGGVYSAGGIIPNNQEFAGEPDYLDEDTDNDGLADRVEGHDLNGNGQPDDNTTLTGLDDDNDGIDNVFDLETGPNPTTAGMGNPPIPGSTGPLQATTGIERDWRDGLFVLPLKLISFTAARNEAKAELEWVSEYEQNFSHFEIERREENGNYILIGRVSGTGSSTGRTRYQFTDQLAPLNKAYYRLRMIDRDTRFTYSQVLLLAETGGRAGITLFPNPVQQQFQVQWKDMQRGNYSVELINTAGQTIYRYSTRINSSNQVILIPRGADWKAGIYLLRVIHTDEGTITTKRVIMN